MGIARAFDSSCSRGSFDEPLASVDEEMSASIRADIVRLHERYGFTGLYVTHDQNEALMLGHRVAVMDLATWCRWIPRSSVGASSYSAGG